MPTAPINASSTNSPGSELYPGLMKGITATEQTMAGNPWDQAALLVDKLEKAGFEADIATGRVRVSVPELIKWLGVDEKYLGFDNAFGVLNVIRNSIDGNARPIAANGSVVSEDNFFTLLSSTKEIELTHAWVRAKVPTVDGLEWVDLDPSWKFQERLEGVDVNLDPSGTGNGTFNEFDYLKLSTDNKQLPLEYYEDQVQQYLAASPQFQGKSLADVSREGPILTKLFKTIP